MSSQNLSKELDKLKYDKRLLEWHVSRGKLSKEDAKAHLDSLPDLSSNVEQVNLGHAGSTSDDQSN
ncbi:MAG: hypothetical protein V4692_00690 [Bdellovibrionota bacterium]